MDMHNMRGLEHEQQIHVMVVCSKAACLPACLPGEFGFNLLPSNILHPCHQDHAGALSCAIVNIDPHTCSAASYCT